MVSVRFAQHPHPTRTQAMVLGGLIGLSALAKFYGLLFVSIPVLAILLLSVDRKQRLAFVPTLVICALLPIVVLAPFHYGGYERDKAEFTGISSRIAALTQNGVLLSEWFTSYLPLPLLIPPLLFIVVGWRQRNAAWQRIVFLVGAALCLPVILFFFGNTLYSRYLMSSWPMLLLACAFSIKELWSLPWARATCIVALGTALLWDGLFTIQLLRDPLQAPLVADDRRQYLETWSSGYGLSEVLDLSRQEAIRRHGILLINHDQPRLIHFSAMIYLRDDPLIQQTTLDITDPDSPLKAQQLAAKTPTYVLLDQQERDVYAFTTHFSNIRLVGQGQNPLGTMTFYLYEQLPPR
jgi:hypothetical protein